MGRRQTRRTVSMAAELFVSARDAATRIDVPVTRWVADAITEKLKREGQGMVQRDVALERLAREKIERAEAARAKFPFVDTPSAAGPPPPSPHDTSWIHDERLGGVHCL